MSHEPLTLRRAAVRLALALVVAPLACAGDETPVDDAPVQPASRDPRVHFKGGTRLRNDLAQALRLAPAEVCKEFGTKSCSEEVHTVALGGVSAYDNQLFSPAPTTGLTTTLIVERMALLACQRRAEADLAEGGEPVLWRDLGAPAGRAEAIHDLYLAALGRSPTAGERDGFESLHARVTADVPDADAAALSWATLSCFAVTTTREFLFY